MLKWGVVSAFDSIYTGEIGIAYYQNPFSFDNMPDLVESEQQKSVCSLTPDDRCSSGELNPSTVTQLTPDKPKPQLTPSNNVHATATTEIAPPAMPNTNLPLII